MTRPPDRDQEARQGPGVPTRDVAREGSATSIAQAASDSDSWVSFALVPASGVFEGQVAVVGQTRIEGTVLGSVRGPGDLVLGTEGRIEGRIDCETVSSHGEILGPIVARKRAYLGDGAHFEGDLVTAAVEVDGHVVWNGQARVSR